MQINSIGIIGYGHFGRFLETLSDRFLPAAEVRIYSRRSEPDDKRFFSLADACACDVVVLAGSISEYEQQLQLVLPHLNAEAVVVDVATVKKHTSELFKKHLGGRRYFCCHPMFGPESYRKTSGDINGYRIAITDYTLLSVEYEALKNLLTKLGFKIIEMTADEHDRQLADTLFMTHYIGQVMQTAGFVRTNIDTVSFQSLMNAVESVARDGKLFMDVYNFNPYCEAAAVRFHEAQAAVLEALQKRNK